MKRINEINLPSIRQSSQLPTIKKKQSGMRVVNFKEDFAHGGDSLKGKYINISQEITRMIPVRGPTLFEKQMSEFLHGPASKSGGVKTLNPMVKKSTVKSLVRSSTHDVRKKEDTSTERKQASVRRKTTLKESMPTSLTIQHTLRKRKLSKKQDQSGYESSESEGTKALNAQYEMEPHQFLNIGSDNFRKLPAIDQARVFILQKSPMNNLAKQVEYMNDGLHKTYLKQSLSKLKMDDPISLNKQVQIELAI